MPPPTQEVLHDGRMELGVRTFIDGLFGEGAFDGLSAEMNRLIMENAPEFKLETATECASVLTTIDVWSGPARGSSIE